MFKRKLDCVSVAFDYPNVPRAPRSCRRKVLNKRTDDDDAKMCAMDLLASLAGKILEEGQSSSASSNAFFEVNNHEVKQEDHYKPLKSESSDQGNSVSRPPYEENTSDKCVVNSFSFPDNDDGVLERTPMSDHHKKIHGEIGGGHGNAGSEQGVATTHGLEDGGGLTTNTCHLEDKTALGVQFPKPVCVDMTIPNGSLARHGNHTNLARDDDEKLFSYRKCSNKFMSYRIRKSKYRKQVPKDYGHYRSGKYLTYISK